jgi:hypothetical protein
MVKKIQLIGLPSRSNDNNKKKEKGERKRA